MPLFRYEAVDPSGEAMEGLMEETSAHRVTLLLQERGAQVNDVEEISEPEPLLSPGRERLRWDDLVVLNDQLRAIIKGGLPLSPSVEAMAKDIDNRRLKPVLDHLKRDLDAGRSLEDALQRSPGRFPPLYISLVKAGERSGNLPGVFEMLGSYSTRVLDLRDRMVSALIYPAFIVIVALTTLIGMLFYTVPQYEEIFREFGGTLPLPTYLLLKISQFLREHTGVVIIALVLCVAMPLAVAWRTRGNLRLHAFLDRLREKLPILGRTFRSVSIARFSKALAMLLNARVPVIESLDIASATAGNARLRHSVNRASVQVARGETIADAFSDQRYFPHSYLWFLANGESRGQLPETLSELSDSYEHEVSTRDEAMLHLVAPVTIVCLGVLVLFIMIALYLPIFSLGDSISGS